MHGGKLESYAQIYIGTLLQSNVLEAQEARARNELPWGYGKPHRILRHNLRRIGQAKSDARCWMPSPTVNLGPSLTIL